MYEYIYIYIYIWVIQYYIHSRCRRFERDNCKGFSKEELYGNCARIAPKENENTEIMLNFYREMNSRIFEIIILKVKCVHILCKKLEHSKICA